MKKVLCAMVAMFVLAIISFESSAAPANGKKANGKNSSTGFTDPYKAGDINVNLGVGYGVAGSFGDSVIPPISLSAEYNTTAINNMPFSFGGIAGYATSEQTYDMVGYSWKYKYSYLMFGVRGSYHLNQWIQVSNLDAYTGLLLGYNYVKSEVSGETGLGAASASGSYVLLGGYIGARYYFTETIGAFAEIGYGIGYINGGISAKF